MVNGVIDYPMTLERENACAIYYYNWILGKISHIEKYDICQLSTLVGLITETPNRI